MDQPPKFQPHPEEAVKDWLPDEAAPPAEEVVTFIPDAGGKQPPYSSFEQDDPDLDDLDSDEPLELADLDEEELTHLQKAMAQEHERNKDDLEHQTQSADSILDMSAEQAERSAQELAQQIAEDKALEQYVIEEAVDAGIEDIVVIIGRGKRTLADHFDRNPELEAFLESKGKTEEVEMTKAA